MSTKKIREALAICKVLPLADPAHAVLAEADTELGAIEQACRTLEAESVGDMVYKVRDRAASDTSFIGNTWEHPRVVAYGEAAQVITNIAKESKA